MTKQRNTYNHYTSHTCCRRQARKAMQTILTLATTLLGCGIINCRHQPSISKNHKSTQTQFFKSK